MQIKGKYSESSQSRQRDDFNYKFRNKKCILHIEVTYLEYYLFIQSIKIKQ